MAATVAALRRHCGDVLSAEDGAGGLQLAAWFRNAGIDDSAVAQMLRAERFGIRALSEFHLGPPRPGLLFGIACATAEQADGSARQVRRVLNRSRRL
jgi:GntR family transcriptional regulator/MocR family aminotransferase